MPVPVPPIDVSDEKVLDKPGDFPPTTDPTGPLGDGPPGELEGDGGTPGITGDQPLDLTKPFEEEVKFPLAARKFIPAYPDNLRRLGLEATVVIKLLIDKEGKPRRAEIFSSTNELFNDVAKEAAMQWLFTPAIMNGNTISVWAKIPFMFRLNR